MHFCTSSLDRLVRLSVLVVLLCAGLVVSGAAMAKNDAGTTEITKLRVERADDALYLSAVVNFELTSVVEEALLKAVPLVFVVRADVYRDRWYWSDKNVASVTRTMRLAFQPLTRRWRLSVVSGVVGSTGLRAALNQAYDSLPEALAAIRYVARWKIADVAELDLEAKYTLEFRFLLDLSQLPRPFQIGVAGQQDWTIAAEEKQRFLAREVVK